MKKYIFLLLSLFWSWAACAQSIAELEEQFIPSGDFGIIFPSESYTDYAVFRMNFEDNLPLRFSDDH